MGHLVPGDEALSFSLMVWPVTQSLADAPNHILNSLTLGSVVELCVLSESFSLNSKAVCRNHRHPRAGSS